MYLFLNAEAFSVWFLTQVWFLTKWMTGLLICNLFLVCRGTALTTSYNSTKNTVSSGKPKQIIREKALHQKRHLEAILYLPQLRHRSMKYDGNKSEYLRAELAPGGLNFMHTLLIETHWDKMRRVFDESLILMKAVRLNSSLTPSSTTSTLNGTTKVKSWVSKHSPLKI